jgi:ubiquitin-protein ligase
MNMYHPNISFVENDDGYVCLSLLDDWTSTNTLEVRHMCLVCYS